MGLTKAYIPGVYNSKNKDVRIISQILEKKFFLNNLHWLLPRRAKTTKQEGMSTGWMKPCSSSDRFIHTSNYSLMFQIGENLPKITWTRAEHIPEAQKMPQTHKGNVETENTCFKDVLKKKKIIITISSSVVFSRNLNVYFIF